MGARFPACIINIVWMAHESCCRVLLVLSNMYAGCVCVVLCLWSTCPNDAVRRASAWPGGVHADALRASADCWLCDMPCIHIIKHLNTVPCAERTYLWIVNIIQIYCCCIISSREIWETAASERPRKHTHTRTLTGWLVSAALRLRSCECRSTQNRLTNKRDRVCWCVVVCAC